jgi:hypothetical protein
MSTINIEELSAEQRADLLRTLMESKKNKMVSISAGIRLEDSDYIEEKLIKKEISSRAAFVRIAIEEKISREKRKSDVDLMRIELNTPIMIEVSEDLDTDIQEDALSPQEFERVDDCLYLTNLKAFFDYVLMWDKPPINLIKVNP